MADSRIVDLAARQHNRVSRRQLRRLGYSRDAIEHRVERGSLVVERPGVYALPPLLDHDDGRWMGAVLAAEDSMLSHGCAGAALRFWRHRAGFLTVTRPGDGGPRRYGDLLVYHSATLEHDGTTVRGIPVTTGARTLIDLAPRLDRRALARCIREALRVGATTEDELIDAIQRHRGRRGVAGVRLLLEQYRGLPLARARSDAESLALATLSEARRPLPRLNRRIAGEEADLSWPAHKLIIEIDGPQFHRDAGEDARKQRRWEAAGWTVERLPSDDVYHAPERLLARAPHGDHGQRPSDDPRDSPGR